VGHRAISGTPWPWWPSAVLALLFVAVTVLVVTGVAQPLDEQVIRTVRPHDVWGDPQVRLSSWVHRLRPAVMLVLLAVACVVASVRARSYRPAATGLVLVCVSTGLLLLVKVVVGRPDPHGGLAVSGGSYPSGHMVAVLVCLGGCLLVLGPGRRRWWWVVPAAAAGLMATALVVTATHWPSDVVGGALLGLATLMAAGWGSGTTPGRPSAGAPRRRRRTRG
jgi:membrane-associated phospholipid phosphatase